MENKFLNSFLKLLLTIAFFAFWPIILIIVGLKALFGSKSSNAVKIAGAKAGILTLIGIITLIIILRYEYPLRILFNNFPIKSLFIIK